MPPAGGVVVGVRDLGVRRAQVGGLKAKRGGSSLRSEAQKESSTTKSSGLRFPLLFSSAFEALLLDPPKSWTYSPE